jgi:hypothetical protein
VYYGAQEWSCIGERRESEERRRRMERREQGKRALGRR